MLIHAAGTARWEPAVVCCVPGADDPAEAASAAALDARNSLIQRCGHEARLWLCGGWQRRHWTAWRHPDGGETVIES